MKTFATLCLLGLASAIHLQSLVEETYGTGFTAEQVDAFIDTNGDGVHTKEEKESALTAAVAAGHLTATEAQAIADAQGISFDAPTGGADTATGGTATGGQ